MIAQHKLQLMDTPLEAVKLPSRFQLHWDHTKKEFLKMVPFFEASNTPVDLFEEIAMVRITSNVPIMGFCINSNQ